MRCICRAASLSSPGRIRSRNSTTVTFEPSRAHTEPSSSPIMPPPITSSRLGTDLNDSAPVELTTLSSSTVIPGRLDGTEPEAMMMFLVSIVWPGPLSGVTSTLPGAAIEPVPRKVVILFFLNRNSMPETFAVTVSSLCASICGEVEARRHLDAELLELVPGLFIELRGMQQRLGRNAPDIEAGAAEGRPLLDHRHLHAELRSADRGDITARPRTDYREVETVRHDLSEPLEQAPGERRRTADISFPKGLNQPPFG